jgi:hypothetical protein
MFQLFKLDIQNLTFDVCHVRTLYMLSVWYSVGTWPAVTFWFYMFHCILVKFTVITFVFKHYAFRLFPIFALGENDCICVFCSICDVTVCPWRLFTHRYHFGYSFYNVNLLEGKRIISKNLETGKHILLADKLVVSPLRCRKIRSRLEKRFTSFMNTSYSNKYFFFIVIAVVLKT